MTLSLVQEIAKAVSSQPVARHFGGERGGLKIFAGGKKQLRFSIHQQRATD
jgi:hypothetical protein